MNPMNFMKAKGLLFTITMNHPKLPAFFKAGYGADRRGFDHRDQCDNGRRKDLCTNMKVRPEDMQLVEELVEESFK